MKRKITQMFLVLALSLGYTAAYPAEAPIATAIGVIRALDFGHNKMIVNGTSYNVAIDAEVDLGDGHGAFTLLQEGWNVEFDYRVHSDVEGEIIRLRRIPPNFVIEES